MKARTTMRWMKRAWIVTGILLVVCIAILAGTPMYVSADAGGSAPTSGGGSQSGGGQQQGGAQPGPWSATNPHSRGSTRGN